MVILIAPLDWGLGHATRCVPLIRALRRAGHTVIPCAGGGGLRLLRAEFPDLKFEEVPGYAMRYTRRRALLPLWLVAQLPAFLLSAWRAGRAAARLARRHGAGLVIADGRYGFRARGVPAVFVTHQLAIIPPGPARLARPLTPVLAALNRFALRGYVEVWVPDHAGAVNLSGRLGHPAASWPRARYIGPLCRFEPSAASSGEVPAVDILALVSGPEPQRGLFEDALRAALARLPGTRVLVRGVPGSGATAAAEAHEIRSGELAVFDHLPGDRLQALLAGARAVVCRSGYTTMMELAGLGARGVLLVPTPGQPEQEYLGAQAQAQGLAACRRQEGLDVAEGLAAAAGLPGFARFARDGAPDGGPADFDLTAWLRNHPLLR